MRPLRKQLTGLRAWITGQRKDQSPGTRMAVPVVQVRLQRLFGKGVGRGRDSFLGAAGARMRRPWSRCGCWAAQWRGARSAGPAFLPRLRLGPHGGIPLPQGVEVCMCSSRLLHPQVDPVFEGLSGGPGSLIKYNPLSNLSSAETWNFLRVMVSAGIDAGI